MVLLCGRRAWTITGKRPRVKIARQPPPGRRSASQRSGAVEAGACPRRVVQRQDQSWPTFLIKKVITWGNLQPRKGVNVANFDNSLNTGSAWHRWDPHVHAPGTLMNNQFKGNDPWGQYFDALEACDPPLEAIGVTDYYLTGLYERVQMEQTKGRLPGVGLIFPNVELRLDVGTIKGRWVNVHLLVSPEDPEHLTQLHRVLARLSFRAYNDTFSCNREDLIRLGRAADPRMTDQDGALRYGVGQFKVNFDQLRDEYKKSDWATRHILIAVSGSHTDGTSGVRDAADTTLREEIEKFAHVIFASTPSQREFWLGQRDKTEEQLRARYDGLKPCLHGSDAHENAKVGVPNDKRFSWVKGSLEFDALRQACIDPTGRVFVGESPPTAGKPSQIIDRIEVTGANWAATPKIGFNSGLVAIIGARGSGKTALADMIALACDAIPDRADDQNSERPPSSSFLQRARDLLGGAEVKMEWRASDPVVRALNGSTTPGVRYPRARYLSQQFVEELCSATAMTDSLLREIERVVFESHPPWDQDVAFDFSELLELRASRIRQMRQREEEALVQLSDRIGTELEKSGLVSDLATQVVQKETLVTGYTADRSKLASQGTEDRMKRLTELTAAAEKVRGYVRNFNTQEKTLLALQDEVVDLRQNRAPEQLRQSKDRYSAALMKTEEWQAFLIDYSGDVDEQLSTLLAKCRNMANSWKGVPPSPQPPGAAFIEDGADLERLPLATLEAEIERVQRLISVDRDTQRKFAALTVKIAAESNALQLLNGKLEDAKGAKDRATTLQQEREATYGRAFEAIVQEERVLRELYTPLMKRLADAKGTLRKLTFTVSRTADVDAWARVAEDELLDLRLQGPFKGKGALRARAEESLKDAWEKGDAHAASLAISRFREQYQNDLLNHAKVSKMVQADYRAWLKRFAQWLFSTDHIQLRYGIDYDGVDIRKLSPGTRGIVLLLLYLALDDADYRPLIIDQPEENLDPKSVFDELVNLFIAAKSKRQVIMVTHNANLVINTDADQIIIADASHHVRGELPTITYTSGGLENASIRKAVCDILEGGEHAFKERARRLRVWLER